jgi:signal peptidase I
MFKKIFSHDVFWVLFFIFVLLFLKACMLGFYLVPSPSMVPNLLPGDRILTNNLAYSFHVPFLRANIFQWAMPNRGDIILFSFSNNSDIYIKRVIGLPGDLITFRDGNVLINGKLLELSEQKISDDKNTETHSIRFKLYAESNPDFFHIAHFVQMSEAPSTTYFETRRFLVPPDHVFVLGDNRDQSADSRVYGFVPMNQIYGKAMWILFSTTGDEGLPHFIKKRWFKSIH